MNKFLIFILLIVLICECKKTDIVQTATAPRAGFKLFNDKFFIDSTLLLDNTSDTLNVTYLWDFGDGITSSEKNPRHSYTKRGPYTIKLTVTNKDNLAASITQSINVSIGLKVFYYDSNQAISDVAETTDGNFIVIGYTTVRNQNNAGIYQPFIAKHDDHLRLISLKMGAVQQNIRITNIEQTNDDGFVVGGNFLNNNGSTFSVTKINKQGDVVWVNDYNQSQGLIKEIKTVNDGFILLGEEVKVVNGNTVSNPVIIKISTTGQEVWSKHFTDKLYLSNGNIIAINDGYIFSSYKDFARDSLVVTKLNLSGDIVWSKINKLPQDIISDAKTVFSNNKLVVYNQISNKLKIFTIDGDYTNTVTIVDLGSPRKIIGIPDGLFIGGDYNFNGSMNYLQKCFSEGTSFVPTWLKLYSQEFGGCARGNIINMKPTKDGNFIYLGLSYAQCLNYGNGPTLLFKFDKDGTAL